MYLDPPKLQNTKRLPKLPSRTVRRNAARALRLLPGWKDPRNRYVTERGNHVVVWPHGAPR